MDLSASASQVLSLLISGEKLGRPELSRRIGVTAPTVASALVELQSKGLVTQTGSQKGRLGRTASLYGLSPKSGWVLGLELGSTQLVIVARRLDGTALDFYQHGVPRTSAPLTGPTQGLITEASIEVARLISILTPANGPLLSVGIALPHVVPNEPRYETFISWDGVPVRLGSLLNDIGIPGEVPVLLENNVNCGALAELAHGIAAQSTDFAFLQVGVRVGAGIVTGGKLQRGANGASGELALLPFPNSPAANIGNAEFGLEKYLGSEALMERVSLAWQHERIEPPLSVRELLLLAAGGHPLAEALAGRHATDIAGIVLVLAAVLDPELVVLGGGVGHNPMLASRVRALVSASRPDLQVNPSILRDRGTAEGATVLAVAYAQARILPSKPPSVFLVNTVAVQR